MKAPPVHLWPHGARRKLHRVVAKPQQAWPSLRPQGLATHFHASLHLPEDMNCQYTWLVGPHLCWPPDGAVLPLQSQSVPQPRPLQLQDLASPCNVLILIKVQMGLGWGWGAQVWDEKGTALPHPYCMPPHSLIPTPPTTEDNALYRYQPHTLRWGRAPSISPEERGSQRATISPR